MAGHWHDPRSGTEFASDYCEKWLEQEGPRGNAVVTAEEER